jgi:hypothetical protein
LVVPIATNFADNSIAKSKNLRTNMWILYRDNKNPTKLGTNGPKNHGYLGSGYLGHIFGEGVGGGFVPPLKPAG